MDFREGVATEDRGDPRCDGVLRRGGGEVSPPCSANQIRIAAFEKGHENESSSFDRLTVT
jgi:hypothetical protein